MAPDFYVSITGATQGKFKGEGVPKPHQDKIGGLKFVHSMAVPRDANTGAATGRRVHTPIVFTKLWGPASPQLAQALTRNEMLPSVQFEFLQRNPDGGDQKVYYVIKLTNAFVAYVELFTMGEDPEGLETVGLTYGKIEWEHKEAKTLAADTWVESR
jgi:type VI secretion system secreted protein Hcp